MPGSFAYTTVWYTVLYSYEYMHIKFYPVARVNKTVLPYGIRIHPLCISFKILFNYYEADECSLILIKVHVRVCISIYCSIE